MTVKCKGGCRHVSGKFFLDAAPDFWYCWTCLRMRGEYRLDRVAKAIERWGVPPS